MSDTVNNIKKHLDSVANGAKQSFEKTIQQGAQSAGMTTPQEAESIKKQGGAIIDDGSLTESEKAKMIKDGWNVVDIDGFSEYANSAIDQPLFRFGLLILIAALAVFSLMKMMPTEQIVKVVRT